MKRIDLLYKMDGLLNKCKSCKRDKSGESPEVRCKGCNIYDELRGIGNQLGRVDELKLTKESYQDLKAKGLTDADIAKKFGVSPGTITYRRKQWFQTEQKVVEQPETVTTPKPLPTKKESSFDEYEALKQQLAEKVKSEKDKDTIIAHLEKKVSELEHLHMACDDVERESARYRKESNEWQEQYFGTLERLKKSDALVEGQAKVIEHTKKALELATRENEHLKGLVRLWM